MHEMVFEFMGRLFLKPNIVKRLNLADYEFVLRSSFTYLRLHTSHYRYTTFDRFRNFNCLLFLMTFP